MTARMFTTTMLEGVPTFTAPVRDGDGWHIRADFADGRHIFFFLRGTGVADAELWGWAWQHVVDHLATITDEEVITCPI